MQRAAGRISNNDCCIIADDYVKYWLAAVFVFMRAVEQNTIRFISHEISSLVYARLQKRRKPLVLLFSPRI